MEHKTPLRLRVLEAITNSLKEITPEKGYQHDLSNSVFRGRIWYGDDDPLPLVSILEEPLPVEQSMAGYGAHGDGEYSTGTWRLLIQGFAVDDSVNPTDTAHLLMADVKKRLVSERSKKNSGSHGGTGYNAFNMNGVVDNISIGSGVVRPPDYDVSSKAYFWLTLTLSINEDLFNPYS